jgi:hypothetical protein
MEAGRRRFIRENPELIAEMNESVRAHAAAVEESYKNDPLWKAREANARRLDLELHQIAERFEKDR